MKIGILGAGALGCAIGGVLTEAGHEVWLINRNSNQVEAMRSRGLILRTAGIDRTIKVHAVTTAASVAGGAVDLLIVLVKSFHTAAAMQAATSLLGPHTSVLSLQNGWATKTCWPASWAATGCWPARPMWAAPSWALAMCWPAPSAS